jgi:hypothetical protein
MGKILKALLTIKFLIEFNFEYAKGDAENFRRSTIKILVIRNPLNTKNISTPMGPNPNLLNILPGNQWDTTTNKTAIALIPSNCLMYPSGVATTLYI